MRACERHQETQGLKPAAALLAGFGFLSLLSPPSLEAQAKPNFVMVIADDHSYFNATPYGATDVLTPNMQALADEGMKFTRAYVASPTCAPSRAALLTGLVPYRNGIVGNHETALKPGVRGLLSLLAAQGYEIAFRGKVVHDAEVMPADAYLPAGITYLAGPKQMVDLQSVDSWLAARKDKTKPVALFIGDVSTHTPWPAEADSRINPRDVSIQPKTYDTPEARSEMTRYLQGVEDVDHTVGEARKLIGKHLDPANTLLAYTADHGSAWPFNKWTLYETGIRTPLLMAWPGTIPSKSVTSAMVSWMDILPTFIDLAGGAVPDTLDGRSFKPVLLGKSNTHHTRIFATHKGDRVMNVYPIRSVRTQTWKYILNLHPEFYYQTHSDGSNPTGNSYNLAFPSWIAAARTDPKAATFLQRYHSRPKEELYRVEADPWEMNNLAFDPRLADTLAHLRAMLRDNMQAVKDDESLSGRPYLLTNHPLPPALDILYPNGGENLQPGSKVTLVWSHVWKGVSTVKLEYLDGGQWKPIQASAPHSGTFDWTTPMAGAQQVKIRITSSDGKVSDESDSAFSISRSTRIPASGASPRKIVLSKTPPYELTGDLEGLRFVEIRNLSGARIRRLDLGKSDSRLVWDGRDESGNPVISGLVFFRFRDGNGDPGSFVRSISSP